MAGKPTDTADDAEEKPVQPAQRLCNEIQLFDLCELERCNYKRGLFCANAELLNRFEAIAEDDERPAVAGFVTDELNEGEEADDDGFDNAFDDDQFGDDGYEEDE